jgi:hypothetical protein
MKSSDPFWTDNFTILFSKHRIHEFWPTKQYSFYEQANAVTRFLIYGGILLSFTNKSSMYILYSLLLVVLIAIIITRKTPPKENKRNMSGNFPELQKMNTKECTEPTENNPFGNVLMNEYDDNPQRPPACNSEDVKEEVNDYFTELNQDPYDIYNRKHSQRQFFSTANTEIPNNQQSFAQWLYGKPDFTCKENALMCKGNEAFGS